MPSAKKPAAGARRVKKAPGGKAPARKPARRAASKAAGKAAAPAATAVAEAPARAPVETREAPRPAGAAIVIEQYASGISCPVRQKRVLRALGLRHPRHRVVRPDNAAVRGMVRAIPHLVRIVEDRRGA